MIRFCDLRNIIVIALAFVFLTGAAKAPSRYEVAESGEIPAMMPNADITQSALYSKLLRTQSDPLKHERAKIEYLLEMTRQSGFGYDRNGYVFDAQQTAKHLMKKYRQRYQKITSARLFIEKIASASSVSGRHYYAMPGDGKAYHTGDLLNYELDRLEHFLANVLST